VAPPTYPYLRKTDELAETLAVANTPHAQVRRASLDPTTATDACVDNIQNQSV